MPAALGLATAYYTLYLVGALLTLVAPSAMKKRFQL
jgi:hypothetical protein